MNLSNEERMQQLLCAYVLNEASAEERAEVEQALTQSPALREDKEQLESTIALVTGAYAGDERLPATSVDELTAAANHGGGRVIQGPWYRKAGFRAAAAVVIVLGAFGAMKFSSDKPTPRDEHLARLDPANAVRESSRSSRLEHSEPAAEASVVDGLRSAGEMRTGENASAERMLVDPNFSRTAQADADVASRAPRAWKQGLADSLDASGANGTVGVDSGSPFSEPEFRVGLESEARRSEEEMVGALREVPNTGAVLKVEPPAPKAGGRAGGEYRGPAATVSVPGSSISTPVAGGGPASPAQLGTSLKKRDLKSGPSSPGSAGPSTPGPVPNSKQAVLGRQRSSLVPSESAPPERARAALGALGYTGAEDAPREGGYGTTSFGLSIFSEDGLERFFDEDIDEEEDLSFRFGYFETEANSRSGAFSRRKLTPDEITASVQAGCERIYLDCRRRPNESPRDMYFRYYGDNPFVIANQDKLSTFAADVDTSSYVLVRNYLKNRHLPTKAQVRTEEFVNYFRPDVPAPTEGVFRIESQLAPSRFSDQPGRWMLRVAVRGREVTREERKPLCLTFVTDTSGSMKEQNRMELVKHALRLLLTELDARDSIAIIGFSNEARLILPMTSAANRGLIESAIFGLQPDGGTNPEAGLTMGYEVAGLALSQNTHNRVVLLSDGVGNIGETDQDRITESVKHQRERGIYLNTIGVGMNNHNDVFLEQLANKGDGLSNYIDDELEARRALVENFTGAFEPIARDVKIQVEFDPNQVYRYRQLGYENRAIADQDFRNDAVDAGEVGAGHQVVCLYELELAPGFNAESENELATVRLRYKQPTGAGRQPLEDSATEITSVVRAGSGTSFEGATVGYRRSVLAAQFAEVLRRSSHARGDSLEELIAASQQLAPQLGDPDFQELIELMKICRGEIMKQFSRRSELQDCVDSLRRHHLMQAEFEEFGTRNENVTKEALDKLGDDLEQRIRDLIRRRIEEEQKQFSKVR